MQTFSLMHGIKRFVAGVTYLVLHQWGMIWVPNEYFNSEQFFVSANAARRIQAASQFQF